MTPSRSKSDSSLKPFIDPYTLELAGGQRHSFLLESVVGGERFGRYSFIGLPARTLLRATGFRTEVVTDGAVVETHEGNPLDFIAAYADRIVFGTDLSSGLSAEEGIIRAGIVFRWLESEDTFRVPEAADFLLGSPEEGIIRGGLGADRLDDGYQLFAQAGEKHPQGGSLHAVIHQVDQRVGQRPLATNECSTNGQSDVQTAQGGLTSGSRGGRTRRRGCGRGRSGGGGTGSGSGSVPGSRRSGGGRSTDSRRAGGTTSGTSRGQRGQLDSRSSGGLRRQIDADSLFLGLDFAGFFLRRNRACRNARNVLSHKNLF